MRKVWKEDINYIYFLLVGENVTVCFDGYVVCVQSRCEHSVDN